MWVENEYFSERRLALFAKENEQLRRREKHMKRQQERMARSSNGYSGSDW